MASSSAGLPVAAVTLPVSGLIGCWSCGSLAASVDVRPLVSSAQRPAFSAGRLCTSITTSRRELLQQQKLRYLPRVFQLIRVRLLITAWKHGIQGKGPQNLSPSQILEAFMPDVFSRLAECMEEADSHQHEVQTASVCAELSSKALKL